MEKATIEDVSTVWTHAEVGVVPERSMSFQTVVKLGTFLASSDTNIFLIYTPASFPPHLVPPKDASMNSSGRVTVGQPAPAFKCTAVVDGRFKECTLSAYTEANHWVCLVFFPKAWSFVCPTEVKSFSARLEEFLYSRSCAVVFCSTDSEHCLKAWNATSDMEGGLGGAHIPLLSDCNHQISKDYGVLIEEQGVAQRALFIIDPKGMVRAITVNDADVGRSVDEIQRVLDALVFKDEFGEGCPVDWKKGDKCISTETKMEGKLELKKSWSEWARPKMIRTWSGASQRSMASVMSMPNASARSMALEMTSPTSDGSPSWRAAQSSGNHSPMISPTSVGNGMNQMEDAMLQQRMANITAAMENHSVGVAS
ncbi:cTPxI [Elasticomyces elasticus]|nr:cTPxI [Elasticomyces elasticus]KAK3638829.1 cTPxI [Elasticomyces elasticus]KAK4913135.1 cTPxI [Elasticomyces elasticus]KAK5752350.1 cTPxI [Elasticomyces elasticus]